MYSENNRREVPDLATLINHKKSQTLADINCVSVGTIQSFDSTNQTASIRLNFKRVIKGGKPLQNPSTECVDLVIDYPILVNCPVVFMNGGGGYLTFPIAPGDTCLVLFCDRDMDLWFTSGQTQAPNSDRMHDLADGIALVGIRSLLNPLSNYMTNGVNLLCDKNINLEAPFMNLIGNVNISNGATGSFTTNDGKTVTVAGGIIISIA